MKPSLTLRNVWRNKDLRTLFTARLISNLGNGLSPVAIAFGVLALPGATPTSLSIVMFCQLLPIVAFMLVGGIVADRFPRALLMGSADMLLSALVVLNGVMLITHTATVLSIAIINLLSGTLNAFWWPAMAGLMPDLVDDEQLQSANSFIGIATNLAYIIGMVSGGILVAAVGPGQAIVIDGLSFLVAGALVFTLRGTGTRREQSEHSPTMFDDLVHGWREFTSRKWIVVVVGGYSIMQMLWESLFAVLGPVRAKEALGGARPWSWILAAWSIGTLLGVIAMFRVHLKRPLRTALLWQFGMASWFFALGLTPSIGIAMVAAFTCGIGMDVFFVVWQTALQTHVPKDALSRVSSYDAFGSLVFSPLGLLFAGPLAQRFGTTQVLTAFGALFVATLLVVLSFRDVRHLAPPAESIQA